MNHNEFKTQNQEYNIILTKEQKSYNFSNYTNYICSMIFTNSINQPIIAITGSELEFVNFIDELYEFNLNFGGTISDRFTFSPNQFGIQYIINFSIDLNCIHLLDYPSEEDLYITFSIQEKNNLGQITERLKFQLTYDFLEDFIYNIYLLIKDIENIDMFYTASLLNFMTDFELDKLRYYSRKEN